MNKEEFRKIVIEKIKGDPDFLSKFLQATGLSFWDNDNMGIIKEDDFLQHLYHETEFTKGKKVEIATYINSLFDKNTFFIVGYPGCGKTTFVTALLDYCKKKNMVEEIEITHCDAIATSAEPNPLIESFKTQIVDFLTRHGQKSLNLFVDFYNRNSKVLVNDFANAEKIYDLHQKIKTEFTNTKKKNITNPEDIMFFKKEILNKLEFKELFYFYCFLHISNRYDDIKFDKPIIMVIDNLDYFDDFNDLNLFMKTINDFTLDMNRDLANLFLYRRCTKRFRYVDKFKFIITMRETTKANIQIEHWAERYRQVYTYYDISEWYEKEKIIAHRLDFLNGDEVPEIKDIIKFMRLILEDIKIQKEGVVAKDVIFPLYNNDYRAAVNSLSRIVIKHISKLTEYESIIKLTFPHRTLIYGARGMLVRWICDEFILSKGNKENYLKKIGAIDFQNRGNNEVSISRLLLAYLSNKTETKCDDMQNCISFGQLIRDFKNIFQVDEIKESINQMYDLRHSRNWSHLISFSQLERENKEQPIGKLENIDYENTTLHYSCAGKIYLEYISSHFEFFAVRTFTDEAGKEYDALFCKSNRKKENGKYKFIHLIEMVYKESKKCAESLKSFNEKICAQKLQNDPSKYKDIRTRYLNSPYVANLKKREGSTQKYFHGERFINTHIGYIDRFRYYILNFCSDIQVEEKPKINKQIVELLEKYIDLLSNVFTVPEGYIQTQLLPYYKKQIFKIKESKYNDYSTEINKQEFVKPHG